MDSQHTVKEGWKCHSQQDGQQSENAEVKQDVSQSPRQGYTQSTTVFYHSQQLDHSHNCRYRPTAARFSTTKGRSISTVARLSTASPEPSTASTHQSRNKIKPSSSQRQPPGSLKPEIIKPWQKTWNHSFQTTVSPFCSCAAEAWSGPITCWICYVW